MAAGARGSRSRTSWRSPPGEPLDAGRGDLQVLRRAGVPIRSGGLARSVRPRPGGRSDRRTLCCRHHRVLVIDTAKGEIAREPGAPSGKHDSIAWSPDGKILAAGSPKWTVLYDPDTAKPR